MAFRCCRRCRRRRSRSRVETLASDCGEYVSGETRSRRRSVGRRGKQHFRPRQLELELAKIFGGDGVETTATRRLFRCLLLENDLRAEGRKGEWNWPATHACQLMHDGRDYNTYAFMNIIVSPIAHQFVRVVGQFPLWHQRNDGPSSPVN